MQQTEKPANGAAVQRAPADGSKPPPKPAEVELLNLHPAILLPPITDIRDRTTPEYREFFDRLVPDVKKNGVLQAIVAYRDDDGIRVTDGWSRVLASLISALKQVPVLVSRTPLEGTALLIAQMQFNAMRCAMDDLSYARVYLQIAQETGWSQAELARQLNHAPAVVTKRLKVITSLPENLHGKIGEQENMIPFSSAYALARAFEKLGDVQAVRDLAGKVMGGMLKRDAVEDAVNKLLGGKKQKADKPVKARTGKGLQAIIPGLTYDDVLAELSVLADAVRKAQKFALPLSSLPQLLRG